MRGRSISCFLLFVKISVKLPVMVRLDYMGAIQMARNITTMACTKHLHISNNYVNEYLEDEVVKIIFSVY